MRIAVYGTGGVGGYFGGRLAQAGESVVFIARGAHLQAIRERGLVVDSIAGDFAVRPAEATDRVEDAGEVDAVLLGVKAWQVREAANAIRPLVGPNTLVLPLQNGVEAHDELAALLGPGPVLGGLCALFVFIAGPGHIRHAGVPPTIAFGEWDGRESERVKRLREAFGRAQGVTVKSAPDIRTALWEKFLFITAMSGVGAVSRVPAGVMRTVPETRRLLEAVMREVLAVGRASGVSLGDDLVARTMGFIDGLPAPATASMQRDVMEGRPSELAYQNGAVARLGQEAGVQTPVNTVIYGSLLPMELKARGELTP